uniref:Pre-mRNA cleavage factor Im 25 kDa subunit n=1 Tax=Populus trichocarpa TaxID=3694 RepID=A9PHR8_POPTR|nr:unknown [Populus trichocarpa]
MVGAGSAVVNTYPLSSYTFGTKEPKMEKDTSVADRLARMKVNYMKEGMRTSVEAILLVQEHNHPHILLLQIGNTFCKLPGGRLKPGENENEGLKRKLTSKLGANSPALVPDWQLLVPQRASSSFFLSSLECRTFLVHILATCHLLADW